MKKEKTLEGYQIQTRSQSMTHAYIVRFATRIMSTVIAALMIRWGFLGCLGVGGAALAPAPPRPP